MTKRSIGYMVAVDRKIKKVINSLHEKMSKDEAKAMLINCGIMTKRDEIKPAYKKILVKNNQNNHEEP